MIGLQGNYIESNGSICFQCGFSLYERMIIQSSELDQNQAATACKEQWDISGNSLDIYETPSDGSCGSGWSLFGSIIIFRWYNKRGLRASCRHLDLGFSLQV